MELMGLIDHTNLDRSATWNDIKKLCDEAMEHGAASVMIPPSYVKEAAVYCRGRMGVGTVIGFPNGYQTTRIKCLEAAEAVDHGATEIDMVISNNQVKNGDFAGVAREIGLIRDICRSPVILKVIVETCLLEEAELIELTKIVSGSGADFIKTSTGFAAKGAELASVGTIMEHRGEGLKVKAAGGIRTAEDVRRFVDAGCERIGSSGALLQLAREGAR